MVEFLVVLAITVVAAGLLLRRLFRAFRQRPGHCDSCPMCKDDSCAMRKSPRQNTDAASPCPPDRAVRSGENTTDE